MILSNSIKLVKIYLKVGVLLHIIAFISFILFFLFYKLALYEYFKHHIIITVLYGYFSYLAFWISIFAELDARSRFQNYKQLKDQLYAYGYQERLLRCMLHSRCQRDAAYVACKELNFGDQVKDYFFNKGYRWYNIIPDFVFSHPQFLLTAAFWKTTFFVSTYRPIRKYY